MSPRPLARSALVALAAAGAAFLSACSPLSLAVSAAGMATDTSITWDIVKHVHGKLTEDDPTPCLQLTSVKRALNPRCEYTPGSIARADFASPGLQECPLTTATRDPRLWRALPELLDKGASIDRCAGSPLLALAANDACPDFSAAPAPVLRAITLLAESDPRAVRHDVFRMFSCPKARAAGLDGVLVTWLDRGDLEPGKISFSPFAAAHPDLLSTRFARELEVSGHTPEAGLDAYDGVLPTSFEEALRTSHWQALEWWLYRVPRLANAVPPTRGGQLAWLPLQRVLLPGFLEFPSSQRDMVGFLVARGADPRQRLPFDRDKTVLAWARQMKSPMVAVLDPPPAAGGDRGALRQAASGRGEMPARSR